MKANQNRSDLPLCDAARARAGKRPSTLFLLMAGLAASGAQAETGAAGQALAAVAQQQDTHLEALARSKGWQGLEHSLESQVLGETDSLAPCSEPLSVTAEAARPDPLARQRYRVKCPAGWQRVVVSQASARLPVLVSRVSIERGATLEASQLERKVMPLERLRQGFHQDPAEVVGQSARRSLRAGQVIGPANLAPPVLVRRGQRVTVLATAGGLNASVEAEALEDGRLGERIKLRNVSSRKPLEAKVTGPGQVRLP
ncbi:flagellar basal body P-ring formation chaperone FlgA [Pseudomonas sp. 1D4]|uniref:flagellar basal body P-ring formation chaperone FlgA n=1 Tax=Pseudomonas sp. 1D4 TaxID=1843691 RepID=UPI0009F64EF3|nr:flagellar basal body P-ring formation chaperone FlgA [Pseudomonas sp. 1D4]